MKSYKIITFLLLLIANIVWSQTVTIPGINLRNKLLSDYPQVMQGNELVIAKAAALTDELNLSNASITNASGIEYFTGISTLDLQDNQLETIPDITSISPLIHFYANRNQIKSLPDMRSLVNLKDFQVMDNQLSELPNLPTGVTSIYFTNNNITDLSNITQLSNLLLLVGGYNPLNEDFDFSIYPNLTQLHVHKSNISKIIGLDKLLKLEQLYAWGNRINDFSGIDNLTNLNICVIFDNPFTEIPIIENKPNLFVFNINDCKLTFEDIQPILDLNPSFSFNYSPQREIKIIDIKTREKSSYTLRYPIENPLATNSYVWFKNGEKIDSSSSSTLTLNTISPKDEGNYSLKIYNKEITNLVLESNTFKFSVLPCIEFNVQMVAIIDKDCSEGYTIDLMNLNVSGGKKPYTYTLKNNSFEESYTSEQIEKLPAGKYDLTLTDAKKCSANDNFTLNRIERCDPVLTPNGDGVADSFFIEQKGTIKIYNMNRKLVKNLVGPTSWDGTNDDGSLVEAGYYILIPEQSNTPIYVTLIR